MNGLIALVGSGEYLPQMAEVDRHLLASVNAHGSAPRVVCLPSAAGREGSESVARWMRMGQEHFAALGAEVYALPIVDRASANDPRHAPVLESADLIYFSGGDPLYLFETLKGSRAWAAARKAWERGAVYAGCSAGAMILARHLPNLRRAGLGTMDAFGCVPAQFILPHFDRIGPWKLPLGLLQRRLKNGEFILGIEEDTALVGRRGGTWTVMGKGRVHLLRRNGKQSYTPGESLWLTPSSDEEAS